MGCPEIVRYTANMEAVFSETGPKIRICPFAAHIADLRASKEVWRSLLFILSTCKPEPSGSAKESEA